MDGAESGKIKLVWLLGADELEMEKLSQAFVVYQGHHGDKGAQAADVVLPGAAWTEKDGLYVNLEGRVQHASRAAFPPGQAKEDWAIIRAFSERLNKTLNFDNLDELRQALADHAPVFKSRDEITPARWVKFGRAGKIKDMPVGAGLEQFYMTCAISRASEVMAECYQASQACTPVLAAE
jgi:NADH-quinone oxidoreductase subunit G